MRMILSTPVIVSMLIALSSMFTAAGPGSAAAPQVRTQASMRATCRFSRIPARLFQS